MIKVSGFKYRNKDTFYDAISGQEIKNFEGYCMVSFDDGPEMIFKTWFDDSGERNWFAEGNNPKKDHCFISHNFL